MRVQGLIGIVLAASLLRADAVTVGKVTVGGKDFEYSFAPTPVAAPLAVVLAPSGDPLYTALQSRHWNLLVPREALAGDAGVKVLEAMVADASKAPSVLTDHTYLLAGGELAWMAFYAASRSPALFAATVASGSSPKPAIDSNRLFGANTQITPVIWVAPPEPDELNTLLRSKLTAAGFQWRSKATVGEALDDVGTRQQDAYPAMVDCETGSPAFARCFWVEITSFDTGRRNDALLSTRVAPGSGASLAFGPFGYKPSEPGPGVVVGWLPPHYKGPLQLGDRIVALEGKPVEDGIAYMTRMDEYRDEKGVVAMVQRGRERKRMDTRVILPKREEAFTARVQGQYLLDPKEILLISRGVGALRVTVPPQWDGAAINWNGDEAGKAVKEGCWALSVSGRLTPCQ